MRITTSTAAPQRASADVLAVAVARPVRLAGAAAAVDEAMGGRIAALVADGEIRGVRGQATVVHADGGGVRAKRVVVAGLGPDPGPAELRLAAAAAARAAGAAGARSLAFAVDGLPFPGDVATRCVAEGAALAAYRFDRYRSDDDERPRSPGSVVVVGGDRGQARLSAVLAQATNRARDLQNTPARDLGPQELAERAREIAAAHPTVTARVRDEAWMRRRGMGAFLGVAQASSRPPLLIELEHRPARTATKSVLGLVGKGITFDAGGMTLKPARSLVGMKFDMSGAAAVLEATAAIAELGLPLRVVTVVGATENLLDTNALKVDDVVRAANGKTIEITNTDAEGRLVLADCLHHARSLGATQLVDLATLTGAVVVALGDLHAGYFARDDAFAARIEAAAELSGDMVWRLPLHDTYKRFLRSDVADMVNGSFAGRGGPCYAARFLQEFAGDGDWAHLDIAGVAEIDRSRGDEFGKGGTGYGVRLLVELARSMC